MKLTCKNTFCRYHNYEGKCNLNLKEIAITSDGCENYKPGLHYYMNLVWNKLGHSNFIPNNMLKDDLRIGLFLVAEIFDLCLTGLRGIIGFSNDGENLLRYEEIIELPINNEKLLYYYNMFYSGEADEFFGEKLKKRKEKIEESEKSKSEKPKAEEKYGWLSPTGKFIEGDWGEHSAMAYKIQKDYKYTSEEYNEPSDMLVYEKNWALIHNPSQHEIPQVTCNFERLTKKQKEFLYNYYSDLGYQEVANKYLED